MKIKTKRLAALLLALALCLGLTGCSLLGGGVSEKDITAYVQGILDKLYLGQVNPEYLELVEGATEENSLQEYEDGIEAEYEYFAYWFELDTDMVSQENHDRVIGFLKELYQYSSYEVKPATKNSEGNFMVEVVVEPIDVLAQVNDQMETYAQQWNTDMEAAYIEADGDNMSEETFNAFLEDWENRWVEGILDMGYAAMDDLGYLDAESLVVQVRLDESDNMYQLQQSDFDNLDMLILAYSR